jgi:FkbM family methyltransferase
MADENAALIQIAGIPLWILKSDFRFPAFARGGATPPELAPLDTVFEHHWAHGLDFTYLDVGAHYGLGAIIVAEYFAAHGRKNQIIAFEPGAAAALIGRNFALNRMEDRVVAELKAVSNRSGEAVIHSELSYPADNHLIPRNVDRKFDTRLVPTVSLDDYVESKQIHPPLIAKIDTQGAEWEVWTGMRRLVQAGPVTIMIEFTPWTFEGRAEPTQFLRELAEHYLLINVYPRNMAGFFQGSQTGFHIIPTGSFESFTQAVDATASRYTDLLCVPVDLYHSRRLVEAVLSVSAT